MGKLQELETTSNVTYTVNSGEYTACSVLHTVPLLLCDPGPPAESTVSPTMCWVSPSPVDMPQPA